MYGEVGSLVRMFYINEWLFCLSVQQLTSEPKMVYISEFCLSVQQLMCDIYH